MSALTNVNYIKKVFRHGCAAPDPIILIETAFQAAVPLLFVTFTFSCTDWIKAPAGISWKCGRKMNAVAKHVFGAQFIDGIHWYYNVSGAALLERALWWWFVADLGTGFVRDWMTLIYQEQHCDLPGSGHIQTTLALGFAGPGAIRGVPPGGLDSIACARFDGVGVFVSPGCAATITFRTEWTSFRPDLFGYGSVRTWLEDDRGNKFSFCESSGDPSALKNLAAGGINLIKAKPIIGTFYRVMSEVLSGVMGCERGNINVTATGRPIELIPAGCFSPRDGHHDTTEPDKTGPAEPRRVKAPRSNKPKPAATKRKAPPKPRSGKVIRVTP